MWSVVAVAEAVVTFAGFGVLCIAMFVLCLLDFFGACCMRVCGVRVWCARVALFFALSLALFVRYYWRVHCYRSELFDIG